MTNKESGKCRWIQNDHWSLCTYTTSAGFAGDMASLICVYKHEFFE